MTDNLPAPKWFDSKAILAMYVEGKDSDSIAKELRVSRSQLIHHLTKHSPENWKEAQAIRQIRRMEEAEDDIDAATEEGDYQKAKAAEIKLRSAQWAVERVLRRIYGEPKESINASPVLVHINLRRNDGTAETRTDTATSPWLAVHKKMAMVEQAQSEGHSVEGFTDPAKKAAIEDAQIIEQPKPEEPAPKPKQKKTAPEIRQPQIIEYDNRGIV